jgi:hypothetical protein
MSQLMKAGALALLIAALSGCSAMSREPDPGAATPVAAPTAASAQDLSGTWTGTISDPGGGRGHPITLTLKVDGETVTGTLTGGPPTGDEQHLANGKLKSDQLFFSVKALGPEGQPFVITYKGKVAGNRIEGTNTAPMGTLSWEVTKK